MQQPGQRAVGIVLAGGGSTRLASVAGMTGGKAWLGFRGKAFLEHVVAAVAAEVDRTIVVAAPGQALPALEDACVVHDSMPGSGPLAGIRDGLRAAWGADHDRRGDDGAAPPPRLAVVVSCDVPLLRPEVVRLLLAVAAASDALWTVPVAHGHRQVLVSAMRVGILRPMEEWLATGRRDPRGLFESLARRDPRSVCEMTEDACKTVDPRLLSFIDIDTPDDLERLQSR